MAEKVEWIYFYNEPKRHKDLIEIGRTGRTVEQRNKDKRSIEKFIEIAKYPVVDCKSAEQDIIRATKKYRYLGRKEILEIDWNTLESIIKPIVTYYYDIEVKVRERLPILLDEYEKKYKEEDQKAYSKIWDKYRPKYDIIDNQYKERLDVIEKQYQERLWEDGLTDNPVGGVSGAVSSTIDAGLKAITPEPGGGFIKDHVKGLAFIGLFPLWMVGQGVGSLFRDQKDVNRQKYFDDEGIRSRLQPHNEWNFKKTKPIHDWYNEQKRKIDELKNKEDEPIDSRRMKDRAQIEKNLRLSLSTEEKL